MYYSSHFFLILCFCCTVKAFCFSFNIFTCSEFVTVCFYYSVRLCITIFVLQFFHFCRIQIFFFNKRFYKTAVSVFFVFEDCSFEYGITLFVRFCTICRIQFFFNKRTPLLTDYVLQFLYTFHFCSYSNFEYVLFLSVKNGFAFDSG